MLPGPSWQQQTRHPRPAPDTLADEESTKEAGLLVHVHSRRVGHCDKQAIAGAEREQPPLVGGVQGVLGAPGPAGGPACFHQQDGSWVGAHLLGEEQVSFSKFTCLHFKHDSTETSNQLSAGCHRRSKVQILSIIQKLSLGDVYKFQSLAPIQESAFTGQNKSISITIPAERSKPETKKLLHVRRESTSLT